MMSNSGLLVRQGNYGFSWQFTVQNSDGTAKNLTGITVNIEVYTAEVSPTIVFSHPCTITNATAGICTYTVQLTDFPNVGHFYADLLLAETGYDEETFPFTIDVIPAAP